LVTFPDEATGWGIITVARHTHITSEIAFERREGKVCYFNGHLPVFIHECEDLAAFRLFSSQLVINGNAT